MLDAQPTTIVVPSFVKPFNVEFTNVPAQGRCGSLVFGRDAESVYEPKLDTSTSMV
jgi:hypothetical protein